LMENNHFGMVRFKDIPRKLKQPFPVFNFKSPLLSITFFKSFRDLSDKYRSYFNDDVSDEEISIIKYLNIAHKTTMKEIKEIFSMSNEKASQRVLVSLVDKGYIIAKGANKNRTYHKI
jgi:predicted HTH transcriptional regulator